MTGLFVQHLRYTRLPDPAIQTYTKVRNSSNAVAKRDDRTDGSQLSRRFEGSQLCPEECI